VKLKNECPPRHPLRRGFISPSTPEFQSPGPEGGRASPVPQAPSRPASLWTGPCFVAKTINPPAGSGMMNPPPLPTRYGSGDTRLSPCPTVCSQVPRKAESAISREKANVSLLTQETPCPPVTGSAVFLSTSTSTSLPLTPLKAKTNRPSGDGSPILLHGKGSAANSVSVCLAGRKAGPLSLPQLPRSGRCRATGNR
jgi:hypothetical protein